MQNKIKVIQYGLGPIGIKIIQYLSEKKSIEIVGAVDIDPQKIGKDIGELAGTDKAGILVSGSAQELFSKVKADAVILTTASSLQKIKPQVMEIISYGLNVISTCEELTFPWITNPEISNEIDQAAKQNNVSVLSTGINPGFLMDFLPTSLTAVCRQVNKIKVERIQNAIFRRIPFQQKIGAGLTPEQFEQKIKDGTLRHVGLTESIHLIASKLGWKLDSTEDLIEPIIASEDIAAGELKINKGNALGVQQLGKGCVNGEEKISLLFRASIGEPEPRDRVIIDGTPNIDLTIKDGINGDIATCAITINAIPSVVKTAPGLRTMADIEPVSYIG